jgi:RES domain-containing protein
MPFSAVHVVSQLGNLQLPTPVSAGLFFRSINYLFLNGSASNVLSGVHAGTTGGRFNPPRSGPTCYLAGTQTNAAFEVEQEQLLLALARTPNPAPRITFGVTVDQVVLLDLVNPMMRSYLGLASDHTDLYMPTPTWKALNRKGVAAPMQQLGDAARAAGYDAVLYPAILSQYIGTALPNMHNMSLFMAAAGPANPAVQIALHHHGLLGP